MLKPYLVYIAEHETDSDFTEAKPRRKKTRSTIHNVTNNNPIYVGASTVYETTPGESFKSVFNLSNTPSLNGAGSKRNYHVTQPSSN